MGTIRDRLAVIGTFMVDRLRHGLPEVTGPLDGEVVFILDGVGGTQSAAVMVRRALRRQKDELATVLFKWQFGLPGEFCTDLCWIRRNRWIAVRLARKLLSFRRAHPRTVIHLLAFSGGAGIAVFACESLRGREIIETFVMACPAISPTYNLAPALTSVRRCYALVSSRDRVVLGLGTRVFGTTDRRFVPAAGMVGFTIPPNVSADDLGTYEKLRQIRWAPSLKRDGNHGGHTGWSRVPFLRRHLPGLLRGEPDLPLDRVSPAPGPIA